MIRNNVSIILFLIFMVFGILLGIHVDSLKNIEEPLQIPFFYNGVEVQEIADLRKANKDMKERIKQLKKQIEDYEEERATENIVLKDLKIKVNEYRVLAGHHMVAGPGIEITLESIFEENIAGKMEEKRYLINLINELKMSGAEAISINGHRVTSRTEVTLAGNHINVNATATAPPYTIRAIGNIDGFKRYVEYRTLLFDLMKEDGISSSIQFSEEIKIPAITKEKPIEFFNIVEENS